MKIKGTSLIVVPSFIKKKFGQEGLEKWLAALSPDVRKIYTELNKLCEWYPLEEVYLQPTQIACDLFYDGDLRGAREFGRFDAENALNTVYRLFLKLGSPHFLIKKASTLFPTYYQGGEAEITILEKKRSCMRISNFGKMEKVNENTIAGWMERAMELSGAKNVKITPFQSLVEGRNVIDFFGEWE